MGSSPSKPKNVKLVYFDIKVRGEPIRMMLTYAGIEFEDKRIDTPFKSDEWYSMKSSEYYKCAYTVSNYHSSIISTIHAACHRF